MLEDPGPAFGFSRNRVVFVCSDDGRRYFGRSRAERGREVSVEEVECLASAGFDIVEVTTGDLEPLCAALATPRRASPTRERLALLTPAWRTA